MSSITESADVDQRIGEPDDLSQHGCVLPAGYGGLRAQVSARIGKPPAGDRQHAGFQPIGNRVLDVRPVVWIGYQSGEGLGDATTPLGKDIEGCCEFLAGYLNPLPSE